MTELQLYIKYLERIQSLFSVIIAQTSLSYNYEKQTIKVSRM